MPEPQAGERPRVNLTIATDSLAWVHLRTGPGDPFTSESHAAELAAARLRAEQAFIRKKCKVEGASGGVAEGGQGRVERHLGREVGPDAKCCAQAGLRLPFPVVAFGEVGVGGYLGGQEGGLEGVLALEVGVPVA